MVAKRRVASLTLCIAFAAGNAWSQQPVAPPSAAATDQTASATAADMPQQDHVAGRDAQPDAEKATTAQGLTVLTGAKGKKGKVPYTGPTAIVELPASPMLDEEGKQRLDPDGKPMFNPPVKQQRDKYGHPHFDEKGKPVYQTASDLGHDENGKKIHGKKEKQPKTISLAIAKGTLTVDGLIGKAALNYDIKDFKFVYLYAPWIGTVVVSSQPFPGSKEQPNAFDKNTLTVKVEDHELQVYSEKMLLGKKPEPAFVAVNREFKLPTKVPVVGYGATLKAPYNWPGARENPEARGYVKPPPVPVNLRPVLLLPPCPAGQMRTANRAILPGEDAPPCVPIMVGKPVAAMTAKVAASAAANTIPAVESESTLPPVRR